MWITCDVNPLLGVGCGYLDLGHGLSMARVTAGTLIQEELAHLSG